MCNELHTYILIYIYICIFRCRINVVVVVVYTSTRHEYFMWGGPTRAWLSTPRFSGVREKTASHTTAHNRLGKNDDDDIVNDYALSYYAQSGHCAFLFHEYFTIICYRTFTAMYTYGG